MKKLLIGLSLLSIISIHSLQAQDSASVNRVSRLLDHYYQVKNALVRSDFAATTSAAEQFIKNLNGISYTEISEGNVNVLLKDAAAIAKAKNIEQQRKVFSNFSNNVASLAKTMKLAGAPVYLQYCPMKKAYWLSKEKAIKNPYYGDAMLSCGSVSETF